MNFSTDSIFESALALTEEERFSLAEALISSLDNDKMKAIEEALRKVVIQRSNELKNGTVQTIPWSEVRDQTRVKKK